MIVKRAPAPNGSSGFQHLGAYVLNVKDKDKSADPVSWTRLNGRGPKLGYTWSRVDVAGSGDGTLTFSGTLRDGSMCSRSGEAARGRP